MKIQFYLLAVIIIPIVSSIPQIKMQNEDILNGETIIGTIETSGEFLSPALQKSDIIFYEERRKTSFEFDLTLYENKYYFYIYANRPGNFTIEVTNLKFKEMGIPGQTTIRKDFSIKNTNSSVLQIKPGFVNYSENQKISLIAIGKEKIDISYLKEKITINPGEIKTINLDPKEPLEFAQIKSYKVFNVPVFSNISINKTTKDENETDYSIKFRPEEISIIINKTEKFNISLEIDNIGNEKVSIKKIKSDFSDISFSESSLSISPKNKTNITISLNPKKEGRFNSTIYIEYTIKNNKKNVSIPLTIYVVSNNSNITKSETNKTCKEIGGKICSPNERCDGQITFTKSMEYCCLSKCVEIKINDEKKSNKSWIIAIILLILLLAYVFYSKYKSVKKETPKEKMEKITQEHSKRLTGQVQRF